MEKRKNGFGTVLLKIFIVLVLIIAIIIATAAFTTPRTFGLTDLEIGGSTIEDMGLSDITFLDAALIFFGMTKSLNEGDFIQRGDKPTELDYKSLGEKITTGSGEESNSINAKDLLSGMVYFDEEKSIELNDQESAALFNMAFGVNNSKTLSTFSGEAIEVNLLSSAEMVAVNLADEVLDPHITEEMILDMFSEFKAEILSTYIRPQNDGTIIISAFASFSVPKEFREAVKNIGIDLNTVYLGFANSYKVVDGAFVQIAADSDFILFNDLNQKQSGSLISVLFANLGIKGQNGDKMAMEYNDILGNILGKVYNNLGKIESAENGKIIITTRTK